MAKFDTLKNKVVVVAGGGKNLGALVNLFTMGQRQERSWI